MENKMMQRRSFTLIEMLVVIAIISILASMLAPSLMKARKRALEVVCLNNLKQMGTAAIVYANENKVYPNQRWNYQLAAYSGVSDASVVPGLFHCPGVPYERTNAGGLLAITYALPGVYYDCVKDDDFIGFGNPWYKWNGRAEYFVRESAVRAPGMKALMVEFWNDGQDKNLEMGSNSLNDCEAVYVHDRRSNLLFADGRAVGSSWDFANEYKASPGGRFSVAHCAGNPSKNSPPPPRTNKSNR